VRACVCVHVFFGVCLCVRLRGCVYVRILMCVGAWVWGSVGVRMFVCTCKCVYVVYLFLSFSLSLLCASFPIDLSDIRPNQVMLEHFVLYIIFVRLFSLSLYFSLLVFHSFVLSRITTRTSLSLSHCLSAISLARFLSIPLSRSFSRVLPA